MLNWGEPWERESATTVARGDWHLWVQHSEWAVFSPAGATATSDDERSMMERAVRSLDQRRLRSWQVEGSVHSLNFDGDYELRLGEPIDEADLAWELFDPHGMVLWPRGSRLHQGPSDGAWEE